VLTLVVANLFDLSRISLMGSAGFLLIFAAVNFANVRLGKKNGSRRWISGTGAAACPAALVVLIIERLTAAPGEILVLVVMVGVSFLVEAVYRRLTGRSIRSMLHPRRAG
jgi:hypothetical protein